VRRDVRALLDDPALAARARLVQAELEAMPAPEVGVELIERLAAERQPLPRSSGPAVAAR
jgi:UDP:flavonoid glycosyltransferase YjiC (YdhE family)